MPINKAGQHNSKNAWRKKNEQDSVYKRGKKEKKFVMFKNS